MKIRFYGELDPEDDGQPCPGCDGLGDEECDICAGMGYI